MSWRDDLPEIPTDRIRGRAVADGHARRAAARQRRNNLLAGAGLAAVVVLGVAGLVALQDPDDDGDSSSTAGTSAAAAATTGRPVDTAPEATTGPTEPASEDTAATEATEAAGGTTVPFVTDVRVEPTTVWEVPPGGGATCGPVAFAVTATAPGAQRAVTIVRATGGLRVEQEMVLDGALATVVFDGFPAATVGPGGRAELLLEVAVTDAAGVVHRATAPDVELLDCGS